MQPNRKKSIYINRCLLEGKTKGTIHEKRLTMPISGKDVKITLTNC